MAKVAGSLSLSGLNKAINELRHGSKLKDMSQNDFNKWLSTKTHILPLSLENNATIAGTAAILKDIANTFQIPCEEKTEYIPFDAHSKKI